MNGTDLLIQWLTERGYYIPNYDLLSEGFSAVANMTTFRVGRKTWTFEGMEQPKRVVGNILWIGVLNDTKIYYCKHSFSEWVPIGYLSDPGFFEAFGKLFVEFDVHPDSDDEKFLKTDL